MGDKTPDATALKKAAGDILEGVNSIYGLKTRSKGTFDEVAIELGAYFILLTFCMLYLLDGVRGKPDKL